MQRWGELQTQARTPHLCSSSGNQRHKSLGTWAGTVRLRVSRALMGRGGSHPLVPAAPPPSWTPPPDLSVLPFKRAAGQVTLPVLPLIFTLLSFFLMVGGTSLEAQGVKTVPPMLGHGCHSWLGNTCHTVRN